MRYRVNQQWPANGGSVVIPGGTIIDDWQDGQYSSLLRGRGVIPPPDVTPLNQETRDWLVKAYQGHTTSIPEVERN